LTFDFFKSYYFLFLLNNEKSNPPINPPYKVLFVGFEVMAQLPELHPTNFQYRKPDINPKGIPIINNKLDFIKFFIIDIVSFHGMMLLFFFSLLD